MSEPFPERIGPAADVPAAQIVPQGRVRFIPINEDTPRLLSAYDVDEIAPGDAGERYSIPDMDALGSAYEGLKRMRSGGTLRDSGNFLRNEVVDLNPLDLIYDPYPDAQGRITRTLQYKDPFSGLVSRIFRETRVDSLLYRGKSDFVDALVLQALRADRFGGKDDINREKPPVPTAYPVPPEASAPTAHAFRSARLSQGLLGDHVRSLQGNASAKEVITDVQQKRDGLGVRRTARTNRGDAVTALRPFIVGNLIEPGTRRAFMDALDATAEQESVRLKERAFEAGGLSADVVIVGAGVHAAVAAATLRQQSPGISVLIVDQGDRVGGQFRSYGNRPTFYLNSRGHRVDERGQSALPGGEDNLNPFGDDAVMQLPYITRETYPDNTEMGDVAAVNTFFSAPTLLQSKVLGVSDNGLMRDGVYRESVRVRDTQTGRDLTVRAQAVMLLTGAGERNVEQLQPTGLWTAEQLLRHFGDDKNPHPMDQFKGKRVAIIGGGDSGKIVAELLLRFGPREAYGRSTAQLGGPEEAVWYGTDFVTQEEYCDAVRSRYSPLAAMIAPSGRLGSAAYPLRPRRSRVLNIQQLQNGGVLIADDRGQTGQFDIAVDCRTLQQPNNLFEGLYRAQVIGGADTVRSNVFGQRVAVARRRFGSRVYVAGPAAKLPLSEKELATYGGTSENTLALWAQGPRVAALARMIADQIKPGTR